MIKVPFELILSLYVSFWVIVFVALGIFVKIFPKGWSFTRYQKTIRQCDICMYTYFLSTDYRISKCPLCGSWNNRGNRNNNKEA